MLHEFLTSNRNTLILRCKAKVARRFEPTELPAAMNHGVPAFLQQLIDTLHAEQQSPTRTVVDPERTPSASEIGRAAAMHGAELLRLGFSIDQVVHEYGDVCQAVTELAVEQNTSISTDEFRTLNRCLDNAIADAVTSFGQRQLMANAPSTNVHRRLDIFADEFRRLVDVAIQTFTAVRTDNDGVAGATGSLLLHTLTDLRYLAQSGLYRRFA